MNAQAPPIKLAEIGQIGKTVSDLERSITFYRDTLGMRLLFQFPGLVFFDCAGVRLMLALPEKGGSVAASSSVLYFKVSDLTVAHEALVAKGVKFESPPHLIARMPDHELWMAFFRDPDEHLLGLMCEVRN